MLFYIFFNNSLYFCIHYPDKVAKLIVIGANYKVVGLKKESLIEVKKEYFLLFKFIIYIDINKTLQALILRHKK